MKEDIRKANLADGWRHGVCSQHYHVQRLQSENGEWLDLRHYDAQMFVLNARDALIIVTRHERILQGLVPMQNAVGSSVRKIHGVDYCISACDGKRIVTQDFFHEFKQTVLLRQSDVLPWQLRPLQGMLFTLRPLNDILDVQTFGAINGAQFCC